VLKTRTAQPLSVCKYINCLNQSRAKLRLNGFGIGKNISIDHNLVIRGFFLNIQSNMWSPPLIHSSSRFQPCCPFIQVTLILPESVLCLLKRISFRVWQNFSNSSDVIIKPIYEAAYAESSTTAFSTPSFSWLCSLVFQPSSAKVK
jgi:hypothetical protein